MFENIMLHVKKVGYYVYDAAVVTAAIWLALWLRFDGAIPIFFFKMYISSLPFIAFLFLLCFQLTGLYRIVWKYAGTRELFFIIRSVAAAGFAVLLLIYLHEPFRYPRSVVIMTFVFVAGGIALGRLLLKATYPLRDNYKQLRCMKQVAMTDNSGNSNGKKRVLIFGAGDAGTIILKEIRTSARDAYKPVGFVDDSSAKLGMLVQGLPVLGDRYDLPRLIEEKRIDELLIAVPSANRRIMRELAEIIGDMAVSVKTLPGIDEIIDGRVNVSDIRPVPVEALLGRAQVPGEDSQDLSRLIAGKTIMVTGAGGSIGSELCRQVMRLKPKLLVLFDISENLLFDMDMEFKDSYIKCDCNSTLLAGTSTDSKSAACKIAYVLSVGSVQDVNRLQEVFAAFQPQVVFHAAAHKHVPMMEDNPLESLKNNLLGTYRTASMAIEHNAEKFVLISTDKAVNPTSIMGATKRAAEEALRCMQKHLPGSSTKFIAVRFGNVLGSRGSVIPLFKQQIAEGGPVTVTHPDMVRYFMTIPEAVQLVLHSGSMGEGGEVFVLDMGKPMRIVDLAQDLIRMSGLIPGEDIEIVFTGTRPGEKLFEELLTAEEGVVSTHHKKIHVAKGHAWLMSNGCKDQECFREFMHEIEEFTQGEGIGMNEVVEILRRFIPDFRLVK